MLDFFRQRGLSNAIYGAIIVATIFAFVVTFRPNATSRTASLNETCVAKVHGRCIDPKDFGAAYRMLMPTRSASTSRHLNLKRVALDGLVERELLDDEAKRLGIGVSESEVTDQLFAGFVRVSVPAADPTVAQSILYEMYQGYARAGIVSQEVAQAHFNDRDAAIPVDFRDPKTKRFDLKIYERQVRNMSNRSATEFREGQARELLASKMRDVVREPIRVSEAEVWQEYDRRYTTATLTWIPVKETWAARWAVDAKPALVEAWAKEHADDVDKELEKRAKEDAPQASHVRHILVKLPYGATDEEKALGLAKLSWAVARIKSGEAFAEVARETSDDTGSAAKGGDVGDQTSGFVPPFKAAADALKPGEMTAGAVETQFGYHFIMKDDPAKAAEVAAQVKRSVARASYVAAKATDAAQLVAKRIDAAMHVGKTADEAAASVTADYVQPGKVEALKILPAPAGTDAGTGAAAVVDGGAKPSLAVAPPAKRFDASADTDRPQPQTSSAFNRGGDPFPGLSPEATTAVAAFAFSSKDGDVMAEPTRAADGFVVVQAKQHKVATREEFDKDRATFEQELVRAKRDEALCLYVKRLRDQAKDAIKVDESFVQEAKVDGGTGGSATDEEDEY
ncbi:MAG: peptidylprolyl isomerase [Polyangiaceae bacterium]|jgi:peptidyl-prolyl cis-trans isomerase D